VNRTPPSPSTERKAPAMANRPHAGIVTEFLRNVLACGALGVPKLEAMSRAAELLGEGQRITDAKVFKQAKKSLGIRSVRSGFGSGGGWVWVLDQQPAQTQLDGAEIPFAEAVASEIHVEAAVEAAKEVSAKVDVDVAVGQSRVPVSWTMGVVALEGRSPPTDVQPHRWERFVDDCSRFLAAEENGAERAATLGWDDLALFAARPRPLDHQAGAGLLWHVNGGRIVELHRDWALIERAEDRSRRVYHRRRPEPRNVTLPWTWPRQGKSASRG
jgi:hypothetical protein